MSTPADKLKCENCKFWSETVARSHGSGHIEALCENQQRGLTVYMKAHEVCTLWEQKGESK